MKIAIDLNDVLRDFSVNFLKYYCDRYNHEFDLSDFEYWTNDMSVLFPFASDNAYINFTYADYAYELFGKCSLVESNLSSLFGDWVDKTVANYEGDEPVELMIVSAKEYGMSIGASLFFLSKIGCTVRDIYFPDKMDTIWDRCDVLITANPTLLDDKPEGKISVKIKKEYNNDSKADFEYKKFSDLLNDEKALDLLENKNKENNKIKNEQVD